MKRLMTGFGAGMMFGCIFVAVVLENKTPIGTIAMGIGGAVLFVVGSLLPPNKT